MLTQRLHDVGIRAGRIQYLSLASVGLSIALWIRAKKVDQDERGNAERQALFVGLWPPLIWLIADSLERQAQPIRMLEGSRRTQTSGRDRTAPRTQSIQSTCTGQVKPGRHPLWRRLDATASCAHPVCENEEPECGGTGAHRCRCPA